MSPDLGTTSPATAPGGPPPPSPRTPAPSRRSGGPRLWASLAGLLAVLLTVTGVALMFFYRPTAGTASLIDLDQATGFGFLRDLHYWSAQALVIAAWLHLARVFAAGGSRRRPAWWATVAMVSLVTVEAWLGDRLAAAVDGDGARLAAYAAHVAVVPLAAAGVIAWCPRRRAARPAVARPASGGSRGPGDEEAGDDR